MSLRGSRKGGLFSPAQLSKPPSAAARNLLSTALPQLANSGPKRFGLGEGPDQDDAIKAVRPGRVEPSPTLASPNGLPPNTVVASAPPALAAPAAPPASSGGGVLESKQVQLLGKALEDSRGKVQALSWEREQTAERVASILEALAAMAPAAGALLGSRAGSPRMKGSQGDGAALLERVHAHVRRLQEVLQIKDVEIAEVKLRHEDAATAVVAREQELERKERALEEQRLAIRQLEEAQHGMKLKISLLERQAAEQAASALRRLEEQTCSLKGEAASARAYQERGATVERQLDASRRALGIEKERGVQLAEQCKRLEAQLAEALANVAAREKKLWDSESAFHDLQGELHAIIERNKALAVANRELQAAVADHKEGALMAVTLKQALEVQRAAGEQLQSTMQEELDGLSQELIEERERRTQAEAALREAQIAAQGLQAESQGRQDEIASLLVKLDEYTDKLAMLETDLVAAGKHETALLKLKKEAEAEKDKARREVACLRESLAEMAAEEARLKQALQETQTQLAKSERSLKQELARCKRLEEALEIKDEHIRLAQVTLAEHAQQLDELECVQQRCEQQEEKVQQVELALAEAEERCRQLRETVAAAAAAKDAAEKAAYKQSVINKNLREQQAALAAKLRALQDELAEARRKEEQLKQQAAAERVQHKARAQELKETKDRNQELEHISRQQCVLIADLERQRDPLLVQLSAAQQQCTHLHTLGAAYSAAYGRLAAHASGLQQQFARQLGGLLQLCRHVALQLGAPGVEPPSQTEALTAAVMSISTAVSNDAGSANGADGGTGASGEGGGKVEEAAASNQSGPARAAQWQSTLQLLDTLRIELSIAVHMLEAQSGSAEAALLIRVPADVAAALQADLRGVPSRLLEQGAPAPAAGRPASEGQNGAQEGQEEAPAAAKAGVASAGQVQQPSSAHAQPEGMSISEQVAQMEGQLERLLHDNIELKGRAEAAAGLHGKELAARQHAQRVVAQLREELKAIQAQRDTFKGQCDLQERFSQELARKLREAANTIKGLQAAVDTAKAERAGTSQAERAGTAPPAEAALAAAGAAAAQAQGLSLLVSYRGLQHRAMQTQHCELWARNLASAPVAAEEDEAPAAGAVEVTTQADCQASGEAAPPGRLLSLAETQQLIQSIYRQKALADLAVARGQQHFTTLPAYLETYFELQLGAGMEAAEQRLAQLAASVRQHATAEREVALFGLAAGLLQEEDLEQDSQQGSTTQQQQQQRLHSSRPASQQAAAAAPLVLYRSRRVNLAVEKESSLDLLRSFCHSRWQAAYLHSSSRKLEPAPNPLQFLHSICAEVHNLAMSVPGVAELLRWVNEGGLAGSLAGMDLGLPVAENQVPQLYLLAVDAFRLLGVASTPRIYVKNSAQAAAFYLQLPAQPKAFHGLNGAVAGAAVELQRGGSLGSRAVLEVAEASASAATAAAEGDWECGLVLTSALVDLLQPLELQSVMVGQALSFHAALTFRAGSSLAASAAATQAGVGDSGRARALCRELAGIQTLGSLCALCPEVVAQRLPLQLAPLFAARMQPVLLRASRYLALFGDRFSLAVSGEMRTVASALVKLATGSGVLRNELNLDAVLQQARALDEAAIQVLPAALRQDEGMAVGEASSSITILRIWNLMRSAA